MINEMHSVYSINFEKAKNYIEKLTVNEEIVSIKKTTNEYMVKCKNKEYRVIIFGNNARGYKSHYAHIDSECLTLDNGEEILEVLIKPSLILSYIHFGDEEGYVLDNYLIYW